MVRPQQAPKTSEGLLDIDLLFKIIVGELGRPVEDLDTLTIKQIHLLQEAQLDQYDLMANVIKMGVLHANVPKLANKEIDLFGRKKKQAPKAEAPKGSRQEQLAKLDELFG